MIYWLSYTCLIYYQYNNVLQNIDGLSSLTSIGDYLNMQVSIYDNIIQSIY